MPEIIKNLIKLQPHESKSEKMSSAVKYFLLE